VKEKEEKEARKLQRLAEEFTNLLHTFKVYLSYQG
jgi:pre-mRNA-processing factor 40